MGTDAVVRPAQRRLLCLGVDAANRDFIAAHADQLPNIAGLLDAGVEGALDGDPMVGAVWTSFYTGASPDQHGVIHHLQWDPARMAIRRTSGEWLPSEPFWRAFGARGQPVVAFDIPYVFPGDAPNVLEICNWGSHDTVGPYWASDKAVERRLKAQFGGHPMGFEIPVEKTRAQLERATQNLIKGARLKAEAILWLMREQPWQVFLTAFGEAHRGGHLLWPDPDDPADPVPPDALLRVYKAVDEGVGAVVREAGPDVDVVLFALHSMGPNISQSHLTSIFMERAIARFRGRPDAVDRGEVPGVMRVLRRLTPPLAQITIGNLVPTWVRDFVVARSITGGYAWADTWGFCLQGDLAGYLRLNLKGREAAGVLDADQAAALKAYLKAELETLTLPDGRPLVRRVSFPTDLPGPRAKFLPDVLIEWDPTFTPATEIRSPSLGVIRSRNVVGRGGNHHFPGFYAHRGPRQGQGGRPDHIRGLRGLIEALA